MKMFIQWQHTSQPAWLQALVMGVAFLIFPTGLPALLAIVLPNWGNSLGWQVMPFAIAREVVGWVLVFVFGALAIWTVYAQLAWAHGTPVPLLPTQHLLTRGPYSLCRNPMVLGTVGAYKGVALLSGSWLSLLFVAIFAAGLLWYLLAIEEQELVARFGSEYISYKQAVPFLLPRLPRK